MSIDWNKDSIVPWIRLLRLSLYCLFKDMQIVTPVCQVNIINYVLLYAMNYLKHLYVPLVMTEALTYSMYKTESENFKWALIKEIG